jgi:hypothetical protein
MGPDWGTGAGDWQVLYHKTSSMFWNLVEAHNPVAIMTFSRGYAPPSTLATWLLEKGATNLPNATWILDDNNNRPYVGGGLDDFAAQAGRPNASHSPTSGNPPDTTLTENDARLVVSGVLDAIQTAVSATDVVTCTIDSDNMGINTGDQFVSAYIGYHGVWYQQFVDNCQVAFHTHVATNICTDNALTAFRAQLNALITWLES